MVSAATQPSARVISLPEHEPADVPVQSLEPVGLRSVETGSYVAVVHDPVLRPDDGLTISAWLRLAPLAPGGRRQALIATWSEDGDGYALALDEDGRPCFEVGGEGLRGRIAGEAAVERGVWTLLEGALDPGGPTLTLTHSQWVGDRTVPVERQAAAVGLDRPGAGPAELLLGAERRGACAAGSHLDGKLEAPAVAAGRDGERLVATWRLGEGSGLRVPDAGPHDLTGMRVNGPLRAVTGRSWTGAVHDWRAAPDQYAAMHFHSDAVDDLGWPPSFEIDLPGSLPSGVYALELDSGGVADEIAFVVRRPADVAPAPRVLVLPTFTYLAYSCERSEPRLAGSQRPEDRWAAEAGLLSLYDRHVDGVGAYEASLLRPLTQLRPGYRCSQHGGPHGLAQDLILIGWLRRRGIGFDVLTDHDLHAEGGGALAGHRTVLTGAHPEYASARLLDALDQHLRGGGNLAYLGGNGLNGCVSLDPERPHVIELRRTETNGLVWQAEPGEHHHASGEYGGDWRRRRRPEHRTLGVGLCGFGPGPATSYLRPADEDPAAAIVFDGLAPGQPVGAPGEVRGGAAGYEIDSHDPRLGSPPASVVLASAPAPEGTRAWPDDVVYDPDTAPEPRADIVLVRRPEGGAVFSVGSIAWTGCLAAEHDNPVARVTANALAELERERPFRDDRA
jgi:N,N-dimethylformamidase